MWTDLSDDITRVSFTSTVSSSLRSVSGSVLQYGYISVSYSSYEITHYEQVVKFDWTVALATIGGGMALVRLFLFCLLPSHNDDAGRSSSSMMHDDETVSSVDSFPPSSSLQQQTLNISLVPRRSSE